MSLVHITSDDIKADPVKKVIELNQIVYDKGTLVGGL